MMGMMKKKKKKNKAGAESKAVALPVFGL